MAITKIVNKQLVIDGKAIFPVIAYSTTYKGIPANPDTNFTATMSAWTVAYVSKHFLDKIQAYENAGMYWTAEAHPNGIGEIVRDGDLKNKPRFLGYSLQDEPDLQGVSGASIKAVYQKYKEKDPNHVCLLNLYGNLPEYENSGDILSWDHYPIRSSIDRNKFLSHWESTSKNQAFKGRSIESFKAPIFAVLQANGGKHLNMEVVKPHELRALAFTAITMNVKGLFLWVYHTAFDGDVGFGANPTLLAGARALGAEIQGLSDYLVEDTLAYSCMQHPDFNSVVITPNAPFAYSHTFNYIQKEHLLIVVNKSPNTITATITPKGSSSFQATFGAFEAKVWKDGTPDTGGNEVETWACELPLNGYEKSNLGNRRPNPACNPEPEPQPDDNKQFTDALMVAVGALVAGYIIQKR